MSIGPFYGRLSKALASIVFACHFLFPSAGFGQTFTFPSTEFSTKKQATDLKTQGVSTPIVAVHDQLNFMIGNSSWNSSIQFKSLHNFVRFYVNHAYPKKVDTAYTYKLAYQIRGFSSPLDTITGTVSNDTLTVSYNPDSLTAYQDMSVKAYSGYHKIKVTITGLYDITNPQAIDTVHLSTTTKMNFIVEAAVLMQKYDKGYFGPTIPIYTTGTPNVANDFLDVTWSMNSSSTITPPKPSSFELEWTYVDNYDDTAGTTSSGLKYDFRNNSTRVWVDTNFFRIPLIYEKGYVVYRVRMVRPDLTYYRFPIYSQWSITANTGNVPGSLSAGSHYYQITSPHAADSMNWQYTISFAEGGKHKHVLSYYDGLLKNRQSITRFNTNPSKLIVTENVLDYEGRPAIKTLPAVVNATRFRYLTGVATDSLTGQPYKAHDFDTLRAEACPDELRPSPLKYNALANVYYSRHNTDTAGHQKFVPDAAGYPFIQTIYSPGYADRIDKQGGAGDSMQIGTRNYVTYDYVDADQMDLNRLFGVNSGWAGFYNKTVTKDPNGQLSMSVKDYKGKLVTSSVIGLGFTSEHAIVPNDNVPGTTYMEQDVLLGTPQQIVGNKKIADKNFYMDVAGPDTVQYEYTFNPFLVCSNSNGSSKKYLSVDASYWYKVFDKCGVKVYEEDSILGYTGVVTDATGVPFVGARNLINLDQGEHSLHKELTVDLASVYAAVDSFMLMKDTVGCLLKEPQFIRQAVLEREFPCPKEDTDPCSQLRKEMRDQLKPMAKYGKYEYGGAIVSGNGNSIFDNPYGPDTAFRGYRYRDTCIVQLPDTVIAFGQVFTDLRAMSVDSFIWLYSVGGAVADSIAEALLPLHPEYCKLLQCYPDTFKERLLAFPDGLTAERQGLLYLSDIIDADPLTSILQTSLGFSYPDVKDSLASFRGGLIRFDTLATALSYCNCMDSIMYRTCMTKIYKNEIDSLLLINEPVKQSYFKVLVQLYLANRERFKQYMTGGGGVSCLPCDSARIGLLMPPLIPTLYTSGGAIDTSAGSYYSLFSDDTAFSSILTMLMNSSTMDSATAAAYADSASMLYSAMDSLLCTSQIDSILSRLSNCFEGSHTLLNNVRNKLEQLCANGEVPLGNYTPEQIRYAITSSGIYLSDLCNPFLINYDLFGPEPGTTGGGQTCMTENYYSGAKSFFSSGAVLAALGAGVAGSYVLNSSGFEDSISAVVNSNSVKVSAVYSTTEQTYKMKVYNSTIASDTVAIYIRCIGNNCYDIFQTSPGDTLVVTSVRCIRQSGGIGTGYIANYAFTIGVEKRNGTLTKCTLLGWTDNVKMTSPVANTLEGCVPCTQMRSLYSEFSDSLNYYGIKGVDHPYYDQMLRSFMNHRLGKSFLTDQYLRFIESCALADSVSLHKYVTYATVLLPDHAIASFKAGINALVPNFTVSYSYVVDSGAYKKFYIDFNQFPKVYLYKYKRFIETSSLPSYRLINEPISVQQSQYSVGQVMIPVVSSVNYDSILQVYFAGIAGTGFSYSTPLTDVYLMFGNDSFKHRLYQVAGDGSNTPSDISVLVHDLRAYMYNASVPGYFLSNFESTVDEDYWEKQALLPYVYSYQSLSAGMVLDSMQAQYLNSNIYNSLGQSATYKIPSHPGNVTNLYVTKTNDYPWQYNKLKEILRAFHDANSVHGKITLAPGTDSFTIGSAPDLTSFHCSDGTYWYRYFGAGDTLFNVFLRVPKYIPSWMHYQYKVKLSSILPEPGDSTSRNFSLLLYNENDTNDVVKCYGLTDFVIASNLTLEDVLLGNPATGTVPLADTFDHCERQRLKAGIYDGKVRYAAYIDKIRDSLRSTFFDYVMNGIQEKLRIGYLDQRFQTTLYYYDRAGNLIRTVPPEGVVKLATPLLAAVDAGRTSSSTASNLLPVHKKVSYTEYNSINKPVRESTPDGGQTLFWYDAQGRVVFSQNEQQGKKGSYSYNLFDRQNRVVETGQVNLGCQRFEEYTIPFNYALPLTCHYYYTTTTGIIVSPHPPVVRMVSGKHHDSVIYFIRMQPRKDVVLTVYDTVAKNLAQVSGMSAQENLRKRISATKFFKDLSATDTFFVNYDYCSYYSYDAAGNVKVLTHDFPRLAAYNQRYKRVDYDYDLISGKVNLISYDRGFADQYYQRYSYDADNRITKVETSADGYIWKRDAEYSYYQHGPLARMSLGDLRVQGVDYAYTLQGWLKAINSDVMTPQADIGKDAVNNNSIHANDAYSLTLEYFNGDYRPIGADSFLYTASDGKDLYNGNIARQTTAILPFPRLNTVYTYDQIHRIKESVYAVIDSLNGLAPIDDYRSRYSYDQDGNIKTLKRWGNNPTTGIAGVATLMDSIVYHYTAGNMNNKLNNVTDLAGTTAFNNDIKPYTNAGMARYLYDAIGNTTKDLVSGQDTIKWNLYNKVTETHNITGKNGLTFQYDGAGNRVAKSFTQQTDTNFIEDNDYYVRDAQGNILAIYKGERKYKLQTIQAVAAIDSVIREQLSPAPHQFVTEFIQPRYVPNGSFNAGVLSRTTGNTAWLNAKLNSYDVSFYLLDGGLMNNMLEGTSNYLAPLFAYCNDNDEPIIKHTWEAVFRLDKPEVETVLLNALFFNPGSSTSQHLLERLCEVGDEKVIDELLDYYELPQGGECAEKAETINAHLAELSPAEVSEAISSLLKDYREEIIEWLRLLATDEEVYGLDDYMSTDNGVLVPVLQEQLSSYGDFEELGAFFDDWGSDARSELYTITTPAQLNSIAYYADPGAYLLDYGGDVGYGFIDSAIAGIPNIQYRTHLNSALAVLNIDGPAIEQHLETIKTNQGERYWLAEHHLYGSSRLGIKYYWPSQYYSSWNYETSQTNPVVDTITLNTRKPWYSAEYQDVINATSLTPWNNTYTTAFGMNHILGQKGYELNSHLGNVHAVVSDKRRNVSLSGSDTIDRYRPSLQAAYDYYPFGMLMPGRYVSDTTQQCAWVTTTKFVPSWGYDLPWPGWACGPVHCGFTSIGGTDIAVVGAGDNDAKLYLQMQDRGFGARNMIDVSAGTAQDILIQVADKTEGTEYTYQIHEQINGSWQQLASEGRGSGRNIHLEFTPSVSQVRLTILRTDDQNGAGTLLLYPLKKWQLNYQAQSVQTYVCNRAKDFYRFGFNGMEKDNEPKGIGNSLDFGARMYDSRIGRWMSLDPLAKKYSSLSPYNFVGNSPIKFIDPNGKEIVNAEPPGSAGFIRMERAITLIKKTNEKLYNELHASPTKINLRFGNVDNAPKPKHTFDPPGTTTRRMSEGPEVKHTEGLTQPYYKEDPGITGVNVQKDNNGDVTGGQVMRSRNAEEQDSYRETNPGSLDAGKPYALTDEEAANYIKIDYVDITLDDGRNSNDKKTAKNLAHELGHARTSVFNTVKDWIFGHSGERKGRHGPHDPSGKSADAAVKEFNQNRSKAKD